MAPYAPRPIVNGCLVFNDKAAHDEYQKAARHQMFIEENQSNWKKVRVFDSTVGP
ncbi:MAG: Dabb family protein [Planctomycetes bacterium]|nr:Dabb family protein [Planctomycetota bacterium]